MTITKQDLRASVSWSCVFSSLSIERKRWFVGRLQFFPYKASKKLLARSFRFKTNVCFSGSKSWSCVCFPGNGAGHVVWWSSKRTMSESGLLLRFRRRRHLLFGKREIEGRSLLQILSGFCCRYCQDFCICSCFSGSKSWGVTWAGNDGGCDVGQLINSCNNNIVYNSWRNQ